MSTGRKAGLILLWIVTLAMAFQYFMVGAMKLVQPEPWLGRFTEEWNLPAFLVYPVGVSELLGGLFLVVPRVASYGAVLIVVIMVGATGTHFAAGQMNRVPITLTLAVLVGVIGWLRRKDAVGPLGSE